MDDNKELELKMLDAIRGVVETSPHPVRYSVDHISEKHWFLKWYRIKKVVLNIEIVLEDQS